MKTLTLCALITLSLSMTACGDREAEPVAPATPDTAMTPAPMDTAPAATTDPVTPPPMNTGACEGLTGQALTDCLNQAGPTSAPPTTTDPATTEPTLTDPTPTNDTGVSTEPADTTTPPQP